MAPIPRKLAQNVLFALKNNPIVFLNGARQSGKSTIARNLSKKKFPAEYLSFDNATQMTAATISPEGFLQRYQDAPLIIDEVQMVPALFRALKQVVDERRFHHKTQSNGRFLLTGSANIMALPKLSDALVGRMSIKTLYPFSVCEILQTSGDFLTQLFNTSFTLKPNDIPLNDAIRLATFPEISGKQCRERNEWFEDYLTTILQRDVRTLAALDKITLLPALLRTLAARAGKLMNDAEIARDMGLNPVTSKNYRGILQAMFLGFDVRPWYRNIGKRLVKSAKGYVVDTLLLCHLLDWQLEQLQQNKPNLYGHVVENFVATELTKLLSFGNIRASLLHFRTSDNKEVDFVLERPDGSLAGIEVKTASRVVTSDFDGLKTLREAAKADFICGIVLYTGSEVVAFGEQLFAVPLANLWA